MTDATTEPPVSPQEAPVPDGEPTGAARRHAADRGPNGRVGRGTWLRRASVVVLVVFACVSFTASVAGVWARRNFLDTERFVARAGPLVEDPAVQEALSARLTLQVMALIDPRQLFEEAFPERGQVLAVPLTNAVEGFVEDRVETLVASDRFAQLWEAAVRVAHRTSATLLRGRSGEVLAVEQGQVTLNLLPMINGLLREIGEASPEVLGREIDLPDVQVEDIPATAIARIEDALDVELGEDFGQFTVYDDDRLEAVQEAVSLFDRLVLVLLPLSVAAGGLALWLSRRPRRTLVQLAVGVAIGMVLVRRLAFTVGSEVADLPPTELGRAAAAAAADAFLDPLLTFALWALVVAIIVLLAVFVTGGSRWAVALRGRYRELLASGSEGGTRPAENQTVVWVASHRDELLAAGVVVGLLVLWAAELSWFGLLLVLAGVAAFEAFVYRTGERAAPAARMP